MKALPKSELYKIDVIENNEPLGEIIESNRLQLLKEHKYLSPYLRKTVRDMLYRAASNLPENYKLLVVTAHRPLWMQEELYRQRVWQMTLKHPFLKMFKPAEFKRRVGLYTAPPGGSSHQCGAATDVTVIDDSGNRLDMGATLTDFGEKCHTDTDLISEQQKQNRAILFNAMTKAGFINYPLEWWHYSFGDRHWAAYTGSATCQYDFLADK